jgi:ubiquinone/menaquinone biosynthesis C-methylase UbiE
MEMNEYSLKDVTKVYSLSTGLVMNRISNYINFFGRENFLRKKAVEKLNLKPKDKVLDLACGIGYNFDHLIVKVDDVSIVGVDYIQGMLDSAKKRIDGKGWKNIKLIREDAASINFPENYFDGVISTIGISVIPDHKESLKRAVRSLKKGGRIVILDAKKFTGNFKILNPLISYIWWSASWDKDKDVIKDAKKLLKDVKVEEFLGGSFFVLSGVKG